MLLGRPHPETPATSLAPPPAFLKDRLRRPLGGALWRGRPWPRRSVEHRSTMGFGGGLGSVPV